MKRCLAPLFASLVLGACHDGAQSVAPVADLAATVDPPLPTYQPVVLQMPDGFSQGFAVAINNHNQVLVSARVVKDGFLVSGRAFLWENGVMQDLGTLGGVFTTPTDINEQGQVVGWSRGDAATPAHAFFWEGGAMQDLGEVVVFGGNQPRFDQVRINTQGQVLGNRPLGQAFLWENGVAQTLPLDFAVGLNNRGQVAGWILNDSAGVRRRRAAVWDNGVITELGTLGGAESWALSISNSGWVVGGSYTAPNEFGTPEMHAFRWRDGLMEDLGRSGQTSSGRPEGWQGMLVNDPGQVGGRSTDMPIFWDRGAAHIIHCCISFYPMDLNVHGAMVVWGGWVWQDGALRSIDSENLRRAIAINDQGVVAGYRGTPNAPAIWLPLRSSAAVVP